jgi:hypothetical protein
MSFEFNYNMIIGDSFDEEIYYNPKTEKPSLYFIVVTGDRAKLYVYYVTDPKSIYNKKTLEYNSSKQSWQKSSKDYLNMAYDGDLTQGISSRKVREWGIKLCQI